MGWKSAVDGELTYGVTEDQTKKDNAPNEYFILYCKVYIFVFLVKIIPNNDLCS